MAALLPCAIGVDIGGTNLRAARVRSDGSVAERRATAVAGGPRAIVEQVVSAAAELMDPGVVAIGLGVPGRVDAARRSMVSGGYVDLSGHDPTGLLERRFGRPVVLDNDVGMALEGERACGAARGESDVVMLTIGSGIGGALLTNGRRLRGRGNAGQLGHVCIAADGPPCACGGRGCLEAMAAGPALHRLMEEAGFASGTRVEQVLAAPDGDGARTRVLGTWADALRRGIDSIVAVADPALVVLGGGLGGAAVRALEIAGPSRSPWLRRPVVPASLGDDAGIIGCALTALAAARSSEELS
jgi:glucokinase